MCGAGLRLSRSSAIVGMWSCSQQMSTGPWVVASVATSRLTVSCSRARLAGGGWPSGRSVAAAGREPQRRWPGPHRARCWYAAVPGILVTSSRLAVRVRLRWCRAVERSVTSPVSSSAAETSVRRVRDEGLRCLVGLGVVGDEGDAFRSVRGGAEAGFDLPLEGARVGWSTPRPFPLCAGTLSALA